MEVNINTKFNIGDTVYAPDSYEVYWANPVPYVVTDILIRTTRTNNIVITYQLLQDELTDVVSEHFLFATHEECKQWCEIQNKEG